MSVGILSPAIAQQSQDVITLERALCFGSCPAYLLQIDSSGAVFLLGRGSTPTGTRNGLLVSQPNSSLIAHFENGPPELRELERRIEVITKTHQWLHRHPRRFTLDSPVVGPQMGGGEDLKNERFVREDVYTGIKPGMNRLMQSCRPGPCC